MKLRRREREEPDVIITPLIDVVFLLLIFFMVSTTFQRDSALSIELPEASSEVTREENIPVEISIDANGEFYVNGVALVNTQLITVKQALAAAAEDGDDSRILINADANTPYQSLITVMDAARQLGLVNLSFPTRLVQEQSE